jgi:hypothetical protein
MSYYILPKINSKCKINIRVDNNECVPYTSHSLYVYYKNIYTQLETMCLTNLELHSVEEITKIINPYEFIFSKVPGSKFSVSKLKPNTNFFYDFLEISNNSNIFENINSTAIHSLHITPHFLDILYCTELLRENTNDTNIHFETINKEMYKTISGNKYDFIFYEMENLKMENVTIENMNDYVLSLLNILKIILKCQSEKGICVIKINTLFHKPVIDILYILSSLYEKTSIIKPSTSNIISFDKYIVCKNFISDDKKSDLHKNYYYSLKRQCAVYSLTSPAANITSIIDEEIPCFFINKIDDINNIIGQQQLESIHQVINIMKNKNKDDKIECVKKSNIQKSVNWCEKFKIPFNKFSEKANIFLSVAKEDDVINDESNI